MGQGDTRGAVAVDGAHNPPPVGVADDRRRLWVISLAGGLLVAIFLGLRNSVDVDVWLHLRIGYELRSGTRFGQLPDPLVLTADRTYVPTQWLGEVVQSLVHEWFGFAGIHALRVAGLFLIITFVYLSARLFGRSVPAAATTLVAVLATSGAWGERPQMAGLVFGAAAVLLWSRAWTRQTVPWGVVPLLWLWACVHGSWILGLGTGFAFSLAMLGQGPRTGPFVKHLVLVNALSVLAVCLTPLGPRLLATPFAVGAAARASVAEWQVPTLTNPLLLLVLAMTFVAVSGLWRHPVSALWPLLILASALLAATSVRTIAFAALLAAPACAARFQWKPEHVGERHHHEHGVTAWMAGTVALLIAGTAVLDPPKEDPLDASVAVSLAQLDSGVRVAVPRRLANWVLYRFPDLVPLQDLRAEVYSERAAADYASFTRAEDGWQEYAARHDVRALVVELESDLSQALQEASEWKYVTSEGDYQMWVLLETDVQ